MPALHRTPKKGYVPWVTTTSHVFLYGSLGGDGNLPTILQESSIKLVARAVIPGRMYQLGGSPGVTPGPELIHGFVYEIPTAALRRLDSLMNVRRQRIYDSQWVRGRTVARTEHGELIKTHCYYYNGHVLHKAVIADGDWFAYLRGNKAPG